MQEFFEQLNLSLIAVVTLAVWFLGGLAVFSIQHYFLERHRDAELESRATTVVAGLFIRLFFAWQMRPLFAVIRWLGLPPAALTLLSVLFAGGAAVAAASGQIVGAAWLFILSVACDFMDGRLARQTRAASKHGEALDSVLDRYSDALLLVGLAWLFADRWVLAVVLAALVGSLLVSYVRAKGEGMGVDVKVGLFQRPERSMILGAGLGFSAMFDGFLPGEHALVVAAVSLVAVGANVTALRRFVFLHTSLGGQAFAGWGGTRRGSLLRNTISSGAATALDFAVVATLVAVVSLWPSVATVVGCLFGAVVNFTINRWWVFGSRDRVAGQMRRYALVSGISAVLNGGAVAVLLWLPDLDYRVAWLAARAAVYLAWNYPLQKIYVFGAVKPSAGESSDDDGHRASSADQFGAAATVAVAFGLAVATLGTPSQAWASHPLQPAVLDEETYQETWTTIVELEDRTYLQVQLAVSNVGPGDDKGVCRLLVVSPTGVWTASKTVDEEDWQFDKAAARLTVGSCSVSASSKATTVFAKLDKGSVRIELAAPPQRTRPPGHTVRSGDSFYTTEVLVPFAAVTAQLRLPGQKATNAEGMGYSDHSRSTALPADVARRWVRFRGLDGDKSYLVLARFPPGGGKPVGWVWRHGAEPRPFASLTLTKQKGAWTVKVSDGADVTITAKRQLFRHAPVEEHGMLGSVVGSIVGNPITWTYQAATSGDDSVASHGILEVSVVAE